MTKRELDINDEILETPKRCKHIIKIEPPPPVNSIIDLVKIGKSEMFYKNLDSIMLCKIVPYLEDLNNLIGMESLKESVFYQLLYYIQNMHTKNTNEEYLHTMILGPPGTGKTTVAKIIGKIYQEMGILPGNGDFKVAYRDDFIAEYLGQTAIKTRNLLNSCIGGVLFIDEVYALGHKNNNDSFAKEALDTLTSFLSEHKNDCCVIAAGYDEDVQKCFFSMNKGLERRFPWVHKIEEYTSDNLTDILIKMVKEMKWELNIEHEEISDIIFVNKELFKNAGGDIETFLSKCKMAHSRRVFSLGKEHKFVLVKKDLNNAIKMIKKYRLNNENKNTSLCAMYL
jgi:replication-associated recombination protein RarA